MPSLRTRTRYQGLVLETAQDEIAEAAAALSTATDTLSDLESGTLDVDAITVGGVRFIESGGNLIPEP